MFKFLFGALAALSLSLATPYGMAAVGTSQPQTLPLIANDGYYIERNTIDNTQFYVRIIKYKSYDDIAKAWKEAGGKPEPKGRYTVAFAHWSSDGKSCTIHMMDPLITYRPQFIGHEFVHCMYGDFHPTQYTH
jgi:hypothetical protein